MQMLNLPQVHQTAIVSASAVIGEGSRIGPYCVIGAGVEIGRDNIFENNVTVEGRTKIGNENRFFPNCVLGMSPQLAENEMSGPIFIGNQNIFRENVTVQGSRAAAGQTIIGNGNKFLANSHVGHDCTLGNGIIIVNSVAIAGHVVIDDGAYLSGLVAVHQHCRIGKLSFVSAGSFVDRSVLPFAMAAGQRVRIRGYNKIGMQRAGIHPLEIWQARLMIRAYIRLGRHFIVELLSKKSRSSMEDEWVRFLELDRRGIAPGRPVNDL